MQLRGGPAPCLARRGKEKVPSFPSYAAIWMHPSIPSVCAEQNIQYILVCVLCVYLYALQGRAQGKGRFASDRRSNKVWSLPLPSRIHGCKDRLHALATETRRQQDAACYAEIECLYVLRSRIWYAEGPLHQGGWGTACTIKLYDGDGAHNHDERYDQTNLALAVLRMFRREVIRISYKHHLVMPLCYANLPCTTSFISFGTSRSFRP